jgi:hypothetical protein
MSQKYDVVCLLIEFGFNEKESEIMTKSYNTSGFHHDNKNIGKKSVDEKTVENISLSSRSSDDSNDQSSQSSFIPTYSRLIMLTLVFPSLRILWSHSPNHTVLLFQKLKIGELDPGLADIPEIDNNSVENSLILSKDISSSTFANDNSIYSTIAFNVFSKIPGIDALISSSSFSYDHTFINSDSTLIKNTSLYKLLNKSITLSKLPHLKLSEIVDIIGGEKGKEFYDFLHKKITMNENILEEKENIKEIEKERENVDDYLFSNKKKRNSGVSIKNKTNIFSKYSSRSNINLDNKTVVNDSKKNKNTNSSNKNKKKNLDEIHSAILSKDFLLNFFSNKKK